ncbi:TRAP-type C4-dicarboxylate transport system, small permease component [Prauserella aidingensis]|uniref:TRAP transporter small permease n=1 Tax=Prauserella aidingensis TaxID=387890 RepID=UPI0020A3A514|nr:TRAP transporter small permease [Prauserella aidingensis]MCP2253757.1 TRAP-type C4-dicarboxylate transport system, small permease component [Prauserella aidingensis]
MTGTRPRSGTRAAAGGDVVDRTLGALAALCLLVIVVMLFANACLRQLADMPLPWVEEVVTGLLLWLTMFGFVLGVRRHESIAVRTFVTKLPVRVAVGVRIVTELVTAAVLLHLAWFSLQYVVDFGGDATPYLRLPRGFFTAAIPVGAAAGALTVLARLTSARAVVLREREEPAG